MNNNINQLQFNYLRFIAFFDYNPISPIVVAPNNNLNIYDGACNIIKTRIQPLNISLTLAYRSIRLYCPLSEVQFISYLNLSS